MPERVYQVSLHDLIISRNVQGYLSVLYPALASPKFIKRWFRRKTMLNSVLTLIPDCTIDDCASEWIDHCIEQIGMIQDHIWIGIVVGL